MLKKFNQFLNENQEQIDIINSIVKNFMDEYNLLPEYDFKVTETGKYGDVFYNGKIEVYHVDSGLGEPGEEFKESIGSDNREAATKLIKILANKGWGIWEIESFDYKGFIIIQTWDPPKYSTNYHKESINESMNNEMREYFNLLNFLGYRLAPCSNGQAWETPFRRIGDNPFDFNFHGLLWSEDRNYDYKKLKEWNNMMKIIQYIISEYPEKKSFFSFTTDKELCWKQIMNAIS